MDFQINSCAFAYVIVFFIFIDLIFIYPEKLHRNLNCLFRHFVDGTYHNNIVIRNKYETQITSKQ